MTDSTLTMDPPGLTSNEAVVGRFAPSPTGRLQAGNIFSYLVAWIVARRAGGRMLLRIEDLDPDRSRPELADCAMRDLGSLGLTWDGAPVYQSSRLDLYRDALDQLCSIAEVDPCFCSRADRRSASAPHPGEVARYPGT
ncbi:MAG: tRNA glutamyl-Q(34) synthetase GluQRS, partial [Eggerthellaceae bacterium]|nr:tRNA glutamyl-Q(34) synthetase GluQRS [Eggerthellaceae bacterium]